jgi:biopolymer transport protein ExbB/TolQ
MQTFRDLGTGVKITLLSALALIAVAALTFVSIYAFGTVQNTTANYRGKTGVRERTVANADFRLTTYNEFFDLCASVQSSEAAIKNAQDELATHPSQDRAERLHEAITAQRNTRAESIATYNSKASQEYRQAFLDAALPAHLDVTAQETQCAA